jgi:hypothetical protein
MLITVLMMPMMIPATVKPLPPRVPPLLLIWLRTAAVSNSR